MKRFLLLCFCVTVAVTASAQQHSWNGHHHRGSEAALYIISTVDADTMCADGTKSVSALSDHHKANRRGFQQLSAPNILFANKSNTFSLAVGGFVAMRASYSFNDAVNNIDMVPYDVPIVSSYASRQALGMDATTSRLYARAIVHSKRFHHPVVVFVDTDFRGGAQGSYTPRLRSAYVNVAGLTFGRDVTTFCDLTAAPTTIDFQGPNAYNFNFSTLIRYEMPFLDNHMKFGVAAELPEVSATYGDLFEPIPQRMPDFPLYLQYMWGANRESHIRASAVLRNMYSYDNESSSTTSLFGWGVQFSGNIHVTRALQFFMNGVYGQGITPYIQDLTGSGLDFTPSPKNSAKIQTMPMFGWQVAAQFNIMPSLFVSGGYSMVQVQEKNGYYAEDEYRRGQYIFGNVFYSVTPRFKIAAEYLWAARKNMNGDHNHANRINLLFKYSF